MEYHQILPLHAFNFHIYKKVKGASFECKNTDEVINYY